MADIREMTPQMIADRPRHSFSALVASRGSGKTHLLSHILHSVYRKRRYSACFVISKTSRLQGSFAFCDNHWNPMDHPESSVNEFIRSILDMQRDRIEKGLPCGGGVLLILDDLFHSSTGKGPGRHGILSEIASIGRHSCVECWLCVQRWQSISPSLRSQLSDFLCMVPRSHAEKSMIVSEFLSREQGNTRAQTKARANDVLARVFSEPYRCMWCRPHEQTTTLSECVYWIKAPPKVAKWDMTYDMIYDASDKNTTHDEAGPLSHLETI